MCALGELGVPGLLHGRRAGRPRDGGHRERSETQKRRSREPAACLAVAVAVADVGRKAGAGVGDGTASTTPFEHWLRGAGGYVLR